MMYLTGSIIAFERISVVNEIRPETRYTPTAAEVPINVYSKTREGILSILGVHINTNEVPYVVFPYCAIIIKEGRVFTSHHLFFNVVVCTEDCVVILQSSVQWWLLERQWFHVLLYTLFSFSPFVPVNVFFSLGFVGGKVRTKSLSFVCSDTIGDSIPIFLHPTRFTTSEFDH